MVRPKVPVLSKDVIADAAVELIDSGAGFGVNALARKLGVTPSSLYNHVEGRDAIIELVRGRLGRRYLPREPQGTWDEVVVQIMRGIRRLCAAHPAAVVLISGKTITDDAVIGTYDDLATALVDGGFPEAEILPIVAVLDAFSLGFGLDLASPDEIWQPRGETRNLGRLVESAELGGPRSDHAFELGLGLLIDSLRLRLERVQRDGPV